MGEGDVNGAQSATEVARLPTPLAAYIKHARLFGVESVYETAEEEGHGPNTLVLLRAELDAIERHRKSGSGFTVGKNHRRSAEETTAAVLALSIQGLVPGAIGTKLGLSTASVKRYLRASGATAAK